MNGADGAGVGQLEGDHDYCSCASAGQDTDNFAVDCGHMVAEEKDSHALVPLPIC